MHACFASTSASLPSKRDAREEVEKETQIWSSVSPNSTLLLGHLDPKNSVSARSLVVF